VAGGKQNNGAELHLRHEIDGIRFHSSEGVANGLVVDLKRRLNNELVVARPPSAAYRIQKAQRQPRAAAVGTRFEQGLAMLGIAMHRQRKATERKRRNPVPA
jgi:hypothetical protein